MFNFLHKQFNPFSAIKEKLFGKIESRIRIVALITLLIIGHTSIAQFSVNEAFTGDITDHTIIFGGADNASAYLTSGIDDPEENGWLRLTKNENYQRGFLYINQAFPSTQGLIIEFDYKTWRNTDDKTFYGADGMSMFLFDSAYGPNGGSDGKHNFKLGGNGGSLGYAPVGGNGLSGGYLGLGIDEYGEYSNPAQGRIGGPGRSPNSIALRGPSTIDKSTTNVYWGGTPSLGSEKNSNIIDFDSTISSRPDDSIYYRRMHIEIIPQIDQNNQHEYKIIVKWKKSILGSYDSLFSYTTTTPPPPYLKIGFAASTGGGHNFHEIRNLNVTTPGGIRVTEYTDKPVAKIGDTIQYRVVINNESGTALQHLSWSDTLKDGNGNTVLPAGFQITNISFSNDGYNNNTEVVSPQTNQNILSGSIAMEANSSITYLIAGIVKLMPTNSTLNNTAHVFPKSTNITDNDSTNDSYSITNEILTSNTLPVILSSPFQATLQQCNVVLTWGTGVEANFDHFIVYTSTDNKDFSKIIDKEAAKGNGGNYKFIQSQPATGVNYYKLSGIDKDGSSKDYGIVKINVGCGINQISIYPNPTSGKTNIANLQDGDLLKVYNSLGQTIFIQTANTSSTQLDLSKYAPGIYFITVMRNNIIVQKSKLIKK